MNNINTFIQKDLDWSEITGSVLIPMTNDYLFRALLQQNNNVLKALICALLHLKMEDVHEAVITNEIELGEAINEKTFILDIHTLLNNNTSINLEMQVINNRDWPERSLSYLCRSFNNLNAGTEYLDVKPTVQIGLLDFTIFPNEPMFYSNYYMMNEKTHKIYSDKFRLSVVDLTHIELATEEDCAYNIDLWASFFKAETWEAIKMLAEKDSYIKEAATSVYRLTQEDKIRQQCEAREDYYRGKRSLERTLEKVSAERDAVIAEKELLEKNTAAEKKQLLSEIEQLQTRIKELERENTNN
jgi:predicted transposase/invertase (TIGR01784 family)